MKLSKVEVWSSESSLTLKYIVGWHCCTCSTQGWDSKYLKKEEANLEAVPVGAVGAWGDWLPQILRLDSSNSIWRTRHPLWHDPRTPSIHIFAPTPLLYNPCTAIVHAYNIHKVPTFQFPFCVNPYIHHCPDEFSTNAKSLLQLYIHIKGAFSLQ